MRNPGLTDPVNRSHLLHHHCGIVVAAVAGSSAAAGQVERWAAGPDRNPRVPAVDVLRRRGPGIPEHGHCSEPAKRGAGRKRAGKSAH